ncbi:MAG: ABC transporter permease [Alistipes sp.]|nr:ABC transporter permease [Alistipes sp.]
MASKIGIIIGREFNERVRKKSFIITTLLMPVLMIALMVAPALIMEFSKGEQKSIAVIDESGLIAPQLESDEEVQFVPTDLTVEEARKGLDDHFAVLYIGGDILSNANNVRLYASSSTSITLEEGITSQIEHILESEKLKQYDIDNLEAILDEVETDITMQTFRTDKAEEEQTGSSSIVATALGYILGFVLYMFLLIYGAMVMQSVIEEKNNRVLEVMVSSVRPFDLMMGKILGVACVAVLQVIIWGVLIIGVGTLVMPHLMPADVMAGAQAMQQGVPEVAATADLDPEMLQAVAAMTNTGYIAKIFISLVLFVFGGFLLYSAMFAAIGSAVDNVQDAQQLQTPVTLPIILALLAMLAVINDPNSSVAFWFSVIPFTSPIVMMARIPYEIPMWEILLSLGVLYASFIFMVWLAAKIYRVGIFMYGKKPSLKELLKWMRYKY